MSILDIRSDLKMQLDHLAEASHRMKATLRTKLLRSILCNNVASRRIFRKDGRRLNAVNL